jgi:hypothetical protein
LGDLFETVLLNMRHQRDGKVAIRDAKRVGRRVTRLRNAMGLGSGGTVVSNVIYTCDGVCPTNQ